MSNIAMKVLAGHKYVGYTNPQKAILNCYQGKEAAYHDDCLTGTIKTMLKQDAKTSSALKICSLSDLDFKSEC